MELINGKLLDGSDALAPARFQHSLRDGSAQRPSPHDLVLTQLPLALTDQDEREPDVAVVAGTINDHAVQHPTSAVPLVGAESAASENGVRTVDYLSEGTWRFVCEHELPMGCAAWRQPNCCLHAMNCGDPHEEAIHEARKGIKEVALTRVDAAFAGSAYAAYGGIYIAASLVWLWLIERQQPTASDMIGATIGIVGALVVVGFAAGT